MPTLTVNGIEVTVEPGSSVLNACEAAGAEIPRFCYHERLSIAGNCRMCLVEMERSPKPIASCAQPAGDGMVVRTDSEQVKRAREGAMEFLLINHPLDCPICDQGGECDLQDQSVAYGAGDGRFDEIKRAVTDKNMGPLIKTEMTRCIHCMRCVRFAEEVAGLDTLGSLYRGTETQVTTYLDGVLDSELSGNVIDLCPVGALTNKPYAFTARSWELKATTSIDVMDAVGSALYVDARGQAVMRIRPAVNDDVNEEWISDKSRFIFDALKKNRIDTPYITTKEKLTATGWAESFKDIKKNLKGIKGNEIAAIVGDLADMESMTALKDLMGNLGSKRIECRQDGAALDASARSGYIFNSGINGIEEADYILLVGANPRLEASTVNTRIRKTILSKGLKVSNIGEAADQTYAVEQLGTDASLLQDKKVAAALKAASKPMIIVGQGALHGDSGAAVLKAARDLADKYCMKEGWNGFNVLHTAASRVGGLDLGLVTDGGVNAILSDAKAGKLKAVILLGADEIDTSSLASCYTVYIGTHGDEGVKHANVILPSAAYTEKSATYANTEGRIQQTSKAVNAPGSAKDDWTIFRALSEVLDHTLPYDNLAQVREKMKSIAATDNSWADFGTKGDVAGNLSVAVTDFYKTNPIARSSAILDEVIAASAADTEATGTNG